MYNEIFKVFDCIKSHCLKNGNTSFEESAVFELLENLYPVHGSVQTIAIVTDMLDAQRIRDFKDSSNESRVEILESDKSNDADSIIEVEVPPKIHPVVDLTNNSPESDDAVIVENTTCRNFKNTLGNGVEVVLENSSSGISENEYGLGDPDISKFFEDDDWNQTVQNIIKNSNATPLPEFLTIVEQLDKPISNQLEGEQSNSGIAEERDIPEMLEENNNDPNNNLDGGILDEEPINNNGNASMSNVTDAIPSCSKDTDTKFLQNNENSLPHTVVCQSTSPVPGCSKDFFGFNDPNDFESSLVFDESIRKDAICIQEIIPWANLDTIYSILKKHGDSPNRKQLTLWDLMSEVSCQTNAKVAKRKQSNDLCEVPKKSPKTDDIDETSLDLPLYAQSNNTACNESSNDSQSSRMSGCNESNSEVIVKNQKEQISNSTESSKTLFINKKVSTSSNNSVDFPNNLTNNVNKYMLMNETANLTPAKSIKSQFFNNSKDNQVPEINYNYSSLSANRPIKKERNETIVSGSLNNYSNMQPINTCVLSNDSGIRSVTNGNNGNNDKVVSGGSSNECPKRAEKEVLKIKKELEDAAANFFQNNELFPKEGHSSITQGAPNLRSNGIELIKPSKLWIQQKTPIQIPTKPSMNYIRPSTFNYANVSSDINQQKIVERKNVDYQKQNHVVANQQNKKPATVTQPISIKTVKTYQKNSRLVVNSGLFPVHIENPFSEKPKTKHIKPATSIGAQPVLLKQVYQPTVPPLIIPQYSKPLAISTPKPKLLTSTPEPSNNLNKPTNVTKIHIPTTPKAQPSATITAHSIPTQIVNVANKPTTSDAQQNSSPRSVEVPDRTIYNKLRSIFPAVRKSYVKKICVNPPDGANYNNKEHILNILIDHLLREGHNHLRPIDLNHEQEQQNKISTLSVDEKYEYLLGIFPDADPTYLRDFVEKRCTSEQILQDFIQQKLEKKDYPTKEQYLAKIKITEQIKQYTTDFKVEKFLELFPDPFKHFEDETRICDYQPIAMEFLKAFFNKNKVNTISRQYLRSHYNLSLTAKVLLEFGQDMKSKRVTPEMPTENIPLLQEIAFLKNKKNIQDHINTLKTKEEKLFKELQEKNLLLTCQCCFNDECMPSKSSECNSGHVFCFDCIIRGTESKLADGEAHVKCFTNCNNEFPLATLQKVLPPTTFSALLKKRQAAEIMAAGMDDLVSCPFCHFASIPPPEDKIFKCLNPECMKETCRQCKELNHIPLRCDEVVKTDKARLLIEEKMTEALLRTCYKCKKQFYKEEGCNKMRCNCGALMCYLCDKPVKGYDHFNPQGGSNMHLCPLWSDDRRLNAEAVRKVAEEMKKAMQQANPNLQIDMDSLLPKLPPRSKGAHDDIPNANELPEHVRRVAAP